MNILALQLNILVIIFIEMNRIKNLLNIIFVVGLGLLSGCFGERSETSDTIKLGLSADYPPFEFVQNGEVVGFDIDLAHLIAARLGKALEIVNMDFSGLIMALKMGRVDWVMSGLTVTDDRAKVIEFTDVYYVTDIAVLHKKGFVLGDNKKLGAQMGSVPEMWAKEKSKETVLALATYPLLVQELKVGRVEGVVMERVQAKEFVQKNPGLEYTVYEGESKDGYAIGLRKGSGIEKRISKILRELRATGKVDELREKWGL